jgi:TolB protein
MAHGSISLSQIHFARRSACAALLALAAWPAAAQFRVDISGVGATQLPIAIVRFRDEDKSPQSPSTIIRADLERSGAFRMVGTEERSVMKGGRLERRTSR